MKDSARQFIRSQPARTAVRALLLILLLTTPAQAARNFDHNHTIYDSLLAAHVINGRIDYRALKADPLPLTRYLYDLAAVSKKQFHAFSREQQLAFLFNAYNAATLKLIIDHYPVTSIKDIGGMFKSPWNKPIVRLFGETITLNTLEHDILRADYNEPRLHMALVCAAKGCPPLRSEAYRAKKLGGQLNSQARTFLASPAGLQIDRLAHTVRVSSLFKWYGDDFIKTYTPRAGFSGLNKKKGAVANFCSRFVPDQDRSYLESGKYSLTYLDYDWSLNEQGARK